LDLGFIRTFDPQGIILSGGPNSVFEPGAPTADPGILDLGTPVLRICYGMQLAAGLSGGEVKQSSERAYGRADVTIREAAVLFQGFQAGDQVTVWASHGDRLEKLPPGFRLTAVSQNAPVSGMRHESK